MTNVDLSLIVPVMNEEPNLYLLMNKILAVVSRLGSWELIFVDDGSNDSSAEIIRGFELSYPGTKLISLGGHLGKSAALEAAFKAAQGRVFITLDADLQNDPEDIPLFLEKIEEGFGFVNGWRTTRMDTPRRCWISRLANTIISLLTGVRAHDLACGFEAFRKDATGHIVWFKGAHRFFPMMMERGKVRWTEIPIRHFPRPYGKSKNKNRLRNVLYGLIRLRFSRHK